MENKHTPGPWRLWKHMDPAQPHAIIAMEGDPICELNAWNREANAALIAAAPEMLEALRKIAFEPIGPSDITHADMLDIVVEIARNAVAKAEGRGA